MGEGADIRSVKPRQVAAYLAGRGPITRYWHVKYGALRGFFSYAVTRGYLSASPLPATVPKQPARFVPHIYSTDELRRLLDGTASYQKHQSIILMEPHTFRAILLLLYGAGLRVSEAVSLNLADVDLGEAVIVIRDTKFYKTRLVPLGSELNDAMTSTRAQRKKDGRSRSDDAPIFCDEARCEDTPYASSSLPSGGCAHIAASVAKVAHGASRASMICGTPRRSIG